MPEDLVTDILDFRAGYYVLKKDIYWQKYLLVWPQSATPDVLTSWPQQWVHQAFLLSLIFVWNKWGTIIKPSSCLYQEYPGWIFQKGYPPSAQPKNSSPRRSLTTRLRWTGHATSSSWPTRWSLARWRTNAQREAETSSGSILLWHHLQLLEAEGLLKDDLQHGLHDYVPQ